MGLLAAIAALVALNYWLFFRPRKRRSSDIRRAIEHPVFGTVALDESTGDLEVELDLGGAGVPCTIGPIDTVEGAVALAAVIAGRLPARDRAARGLAARDLLREANDSREPHAPPITAEQLAARLQLAAIRSNAGGGMTFFYLTDGLFAGRDVQVTVDQTRGPLDARVGR